MTGDKAFRQIQEEYERLRAIDPDAPHAELWRHAKNAAAGGGPAEQHVRMTPLAWIGLTLRRTLWVVTFRTEHFESLMNDPRSRGQGIAVTAVAGAGAQLAAEGAPLFLVAGGAFVSVALLLLWSAMFSGVAELFGGTHTLRQLLSVAGFSGVLMLLSAIQLLTATGPVAWFGWVVFLAMLGYMIATQITGLVTTGLMSLPRAVAAAVASFTVSVAALFLMGLFILLLLASSGI